jgi:hypothetical protein
VACNVIHLALGRVGPGSSPVITLH